MSSFDTALRPLLGARDGSFAAHTQTTDAPIVTDLYRAPAVLLGGEKVAGITKVTCFDFRRMQESSGTAFAGVLGMDALWNWIIRIDFDHGELSLLESLPNDTGRAISLVLCYDVPSVRLGPAGTDAGIFLVDTGHLGGSGTLRSRRYRALLDRGELHTIGEHSIGSVFGPSRRRYAKLTEFKLAGFEHRELIFSEGSLNSLSLDYLSRYVVTFDFANEQMYLRPGRRFHEPDRHDLSGLRLSRVGGKGETVVASLDEGSVAARAGIRKGDIITAFDSKPAMELTITQIRRMLGTPSVISITYRRRSEVLHAELRLNEMKAKVR